MKEWEKLNNRVNKIKVAQDLVQKILFDVTTLQEILQEIFKDSSVQSCACCDNCDCMIPSSSAFTIRINNKNDLIRLCVECNAIREGIKIVPYEEKTSAEWNKLYKASTYGILLHFTTKINNVCEEYKRMIE